MLRLKTPFQTYGSQFRGFGASLSLRWNAQKKKLFHENNQSTQKPRFKPFSRPRWPFWGHLVTILDCEGGEVLQSVSNCPRRR